MNDVRGPGLPLLMAVCIALLVGGALAVTWWRQPSPADLREQLGSPPRPPQQAATGPRTFRSRSPRLSMPPRPLADERVEQLQGELEQARAQIARLEEFRARYRARFPAEADVDWSVALDAIGRDARALLAEEGVVPPEDTAQPADNAGPADPSTPPDVPDQAAADPDLDRRIRDLQSRLEIAQFLDEQQRGENERLRADLAELTEALTQEMERVSERSEQLEVERLLVDEASRSLITLGPSAIPRLVSALGSDDAYIREWAADVLGAMGTAGSAALPDLVDARSDPDAAVRAAIRRAIDAIERGDDP
jgi:hypothetical protein